MPVCPQCDHRHFASKQALSQHMQTSGSWHPFCSMCDRRFASETAFDGHMAAKHPPTYDCTVCNRSYHAPFALEDHYRGSTVHPNCGRCGRGFKDAPACEEHRRTAHPKTRCLPCGGRIFCRDALDRHYWNSVNHPSCIPCNNGFRDDAAYAEHVSAAHPELQCRPCCRHFETADAIQAHFTFSPDHPKCTECGLGFEDDGARNAHIERTHDPLSPQLQTTVEDRVDHGVSPSNDRNGSLHSLSNGEMSSTASSLIAMERRMKSPDLRLKMEFTSPLKEVKPLFNATRLPRPGDIIGELWSSPGNVQVSAPRTFPHRSPEGGPPGLPSKPPVWTPASVLHSQQSSTPMITINPLRSYTSSANSRNLTESMPRLHTFPPSFSPPTRYHDPLSPGRNLHSPPALSTSAGFDRSVPPGRSMHSAPTSAASTSFDTSRVSTRREERHFLPPRTSPPRSELHSRLYPGIVRRAARMMAVNRPSYPLGPTFEPNWRKSMDVGGESDTRTFEGGKQQQSKISTPVGGTPVGNVHMHANSPSLATASSPTSSALARSPASGLNDRETQPTTASSTRTPSLRGLSYTITPSSECVSPRPPEFTSPDDLEVLPAIYPLITTPVGLEISKFDIPGAQQPLPASAAGSLSPVTVVTAKKTQDVPVLAILPLSTSSSESYVTSPKNPVDEAKLYLKNDDLSAIPPAIPGIPLVPFTNSNPFHCRVCRADMCDDITVSFLQSVHHRCSY